MATYELTGYKLSLNSLNNNFDVYTNSKDELVYYIQVDNIRVEVLKGDNNNYYVLEEHFLNASRMIKKITQQLTRVNLGDDERDLLLDKQEKILGLRSDDTQTFNYTIN